MTTERLAKLLEARLILDPATGKPVPTPPPRAKQMDRPGISVDGGRTWHNDARYIPAAPQEPFEVTTTRQPIRAGAWNPGSDAAGMIKIWNDQNPDPIVDVNGRPWPSY